MKKSLAFQILSILALLTIMPSMELHAGLEGGLTTKNRQWQNALVLPMAKPSREDRNQELNQRKKDIAQQISLLKDRLKRTPDSATLEKANAKLKEIQKNAGWAPEIEFVFSLDGIDHQIKNSRVLDEGLLKSYLQLQKDLKKRNIDLIVMPFPDSSHFYTHRVVEGLEAKDEYYPGYTEMLFTFLENDIEIVDFMDELREAANGDVPVHWPNDPHTASMGRQVAAQALAKRLQRYDFASARKPVADSIPMKTVEWKGATTGWSQYLLNARKAGDNRKDPLKSTNIPSIMDKMAQRTMKRLQPVWPNADPKHKNKQRHHGSLDIAKQGFEDLVFIGDSQLHTAVFGAGLPEFIMANVGGACRWGSKSWSGFSLPEIYLETVPNNHAAQPRVVAVFHLFSKLPAKEKSKFKPKPLPELGASSPGALASTPFNARVKVKRFSKP